MAKPTRRKANSKNYQHQKERDIPDWNENEEVKAHIGTNSCVRVNWKKQTTLHVRYGEKERQGERCSTIVLYLTGLSWSILRYVSSPEIRWSIKKRRQRLTAPLCETHVGTVETEEAPQKAKSNRSTELRREIMSAKKREYTCKL